jgi:lipoprotein-anchoring transpeptidase ErfK/SrfK
MPYWLGLDDGRVGIHELPVWPNGYVEGEDHLGTPVSHGCIRLGHESAEFLYNWVEVEIEVFIY